MQIVQLSFLENVSWTKSGPAKAGPAGPLVVWLARPSHLIAGALRAGRDGLAAVTISSHLFSTNQMLLAGIRANSIHSLLNHAYYAFQWQWICFLLEMEPPDAEGVVVRSRDRSLVSSLKERVSRRNLISQSARPGVDILSRLTFNTVR